jgi:hypothetical protein
MSQRELRAVATSHHRPSHEVGAPLVHPTTLPRGPPPAPVQQDPAMWWGARTNSIQPQGAIIHTSLHRLMAFGEGLSGIRGQNVQPATPNLRS